MSKLTEAIRRVTGVRLSEAGRSASMLKGVAKNTGVPLGTVKKSDNLRMKKKVRGVDAIDKALNLKKNLVLNVIHATDNYDVYAPKIKLHKRYER